MQTYKIVENDPVLISQPSLIDHFGRAAAQFISQLHYWLEHPQCGKQHHGRKWIYNTEVSWANQLKLSVRQFRRHILSLSNQGIIFVQKLSPHKSNRTNYIAINYELLNGILNNNNFPTLDTSSKISTLTHEDTMSSPAGRYVPVYIETKITNKDINKSEGLEKKSQVVGHGDQVSKKTSQVKQVKNLTLENQKVLEAKLPVPTGAIVIAREPARSTTLTSSLVKTSIAQDMLKAWNHHFVDQDANKPKSRLSKEIAPMLVAAFKTKFESNLAHWQSYCEQIKSSPYLMGDSFKLTLSWALKFGTIDRIRAGDLGVKITQNQTIPSGDSLKKQDENVDQAIEALPENSSLKAIRRQIAKAIGAGHYLSWFHPAEFCETGGKLRMKAPNAFIQDWWETHYDQILKLVANELELVDQLTSSTGMDSLLNENQTGQGHEAASVGDTPPSANSETYQKIEALLESQSVKELRHKIAQAIGDAEYNSWFHAAKFCEMGGEIRLLAPNFFVEKYWKEHFSWIN
jgi:DnaA N-terminal domain